MWYNECNNSWSLWPLPLRGQSLHCKCYTEKACWVDWLCKGWGVCSEEWRCCSLTWSSHSREEAQYASIVIHSLESNQYLVLFSVGWFSLFYHKFHNLINLKFPLLRPDYYKRKTRESPVFRGKSKFLPFTNVGKHDNLNLNSTSTKGKQNDPRFVPWNLGELGKGGMAGEHGMSVENFWVLAVGSTINVKLTVKDQ